MSKTTMVYFGVLQLRSPAAQIAEHNCSRKTSQPGDQALQIDKTIKGAMKLINESLCIDEKLRSEAIQKFLDPRQDIARLK